MKPDNDNNQMSAQTEDAGAMASVERKAELLTSIKKQSIKKSVKNFIFGGLCAFIASWHFYSMRYSCPCNMRGYIIGVFFLMGAVWFVFKAATYLRCKRAGVGQEIQRQIDRLINSENYIYQFVFWPWAMLGICAKMMGRYPWYGIVIAMGVVTALMALYWKMMRQVTIDNYRDEDVEELIALEKENQ